MLRHIVLFQFSEHCAAYMTCYYMLHLPALCGVCRGPIACISEVTGNGFVCKQPPVFSCLRKVSVIVACAIARNVHQGYMGGSNHLLARKKKFMNSYIIYTLFLHYSVARLLNSTIVIKTFYNDSVH